MDILIGLHARMCFTPSDSTRGMTALRISRRGTYNENLKYWPVELAIDGTCTYSGNSWPYHYLARIGVLRDDFGDLKAVSLGEGTVTFDTSAAVAMRARARAATQSQASSGTSAEFVQDNRSRSAEASDSSAAATVLASLYAAERQLFEDKSEYAPLATLNWRNPNPNVEVVIDYVGAMGFNATARVRGSATRMVCGVATGSGAAPWGGMPGTVRCGIWIRMFGQ